MSDAIKCKAKICEEGGGGNILPIFGDAELKANKFPLRSILYLFGLLWCFMGVAIVSDIFMGAIERITSKKVRIQDPKTGKNVTVKVWNDTVANLTLMALGSSAPEILLSVIELTTNQFLSGDLGPATIVGSAAFNLLCISAVCVVAIPAGEVRKIKDVGVFAVTASFSIFAYLWLYFIVLILSPDEIDIGEGVLTFIFFPVLVILAFCADKGYFTFDETFSKASGSRVPKCARAHEMEYLATSRDADGWGCDGRFEPGGCKSGITGYHQTKGVERYRCEVCDYDLCKKCVESSRRVCLPHVIDGDCSRDELAAIELRILQQHGDGLTDDQMVKLIQKEHGGQQSRAAYRVAAIRNMVGGRKIANIESPQQYSFSTIVPIDSRSAESDRKPFLCPKNHPMNTFITNKANFNCDVCAKIFPSGTLLYGCRICNFDACAVCKVGFVKADVTIQFQSASYAVLESVGTLVCQVLRLGDPSHRVFVEYRTRDGTAKAHEDYIPVEGRLEFDVNEVQKSIEIQIVDDTSYEEDEEFFVDLLNATSSFQGTKVVVGENRSAKVSIVDDDMPGVLSFTEDTKQVTEGINNQVITVTVKRENGSAGVVSCKFRTEDATATAGRDYLACSGTLTFECGQLSRDIQLTVLCGAHYDSTEEFRLIIENAEGGATFDATTDGKEECCVCTVVILSDEAARGRVDRVMKVLMMDWDKAHIGHKNWKEQFLDAMYVNGGEDGEAGIFDYIMHGITVFWKVLFACIPPPDFCDGWLCFICALIMIGVVTAFIGDLASFLGCTLNIPDKITAITFVALGTSLPDTFASKTAAEQDPYADASIGNVTGSNSVNVFLGLGLPWVIGSIYWKAVGQTDVWKDEYAAKHPKWVAENRGMFVVIGGELGFSVAIFSACAVMCIFTLLLRRKLFGGELGGPRTPQLATAAFLVFLWLLYIGLSSYHIMANRGDCG